MATRFLASASNSSSKATVGRRAGVRPERQSDTPTHQGRGACGRSRRRLRRSQRAGRTGSPHDGGESAARRGDAARPVVQSSYGGGVYPRRARRCRVDVPGVGAARRSGPPTGDDDARLVVFFWFFSLSTPPIQQRTSSSQTRAVGARLPPRRVQTRSLDILPAVAYLDLTNGCRLFQLCTRPLTRRLRKTCAAGRDTVRHKANNAVQHAVHGAHPASRYPAAPMQRRSRRAPRRRQASTAAIHAATP